MTTDRGPGRIALSLGAGSTLSLTLWILLLPWNLSTHRDGRPIAEAPTQADQMKLLALAFGIPFVVGTICAVFGWVRITSFGLAAGMTWTVLTTYRGMAAEVDGANMAALWPFLGIPATAVATVLSNTIVTAVAHVSSDGGGAPDSTA